MSLHAYLQGHVNEAIDMAEGAYEQGKHQAAPRVLAFAKLAEARAHGKADDASCPLHEAAALLTDHAGQRLTWAARSLDPQGDLA
ncbi:MULTISPECIES: hypothetical protein [unclassified Streptomyces]|uniref:hypothetical protein n=1 Tax=unclassified Streptomyces TaxID=2593676 RepID=UPI002E28794C|nr:hypothetical protein [Streptomyces sp. NBC_01439]